MNLKYKKRGIDYGVSMDFVANMTSTESSTYFVLRQYRTTKCYSQQWNNKRYNMNETPSFTNGPIFNIAQIWPYRVRVRVFHASTPN